MASPLVQPQPPQPPQLPPSSQLVPSPQLSASLLVTKKSETLGFYGKMMGVLEQSLFFSMFDGRFGGIPMNFRHTHLLPASNGDTCIYLSCCQSSTHHSGCILTLDVQHVWGQDRSYCQTWGCNCPNKTHSIHILSHCIWRIPLLIIPSNPVKIQHFCW